MSRVNENSQELGQRSSDTASCVCGDRSHLGVKHRKTGPCYSKLREWTVHAKSMPETMVSVLAISQGKAKVLVWRMAREAGYRIPYTDFVATRFK